MSPGENNIYFLKMLQFSVYKGNPYLSKLKKKHHTVWGPPWWFSDLRICWAMQHTWARFLARKLRALLPQSS